MPLSNITFNKSVSVKTKGSIEFIYNGESWVKEAAYVANSFYN